MFLSVQAITFEPLHIETSFLLCRHIFTISRSSLSIQVIGSRSRSYEKDDNFTDFNMLILYLWLQVINKVKVTHQCQSKNIDLISNFMSNFPYFNKSILKFMSNFTYFNKLILYVWLQIINKVKFIHQGEGHINVKVKYLHPFKFYVAHTL